jgi:hypothetical protein
MYKELIQFQSLEEKMKKTIILAIAFMVVLVTIPAFASVQNVKISGSVDSTYLFRDNFDLGANILGDEQQNLFITQTILRTDADLTDQVSATVALINERAWGNDNQTTAAANATTSTDVDLLLAYVTLREMLYSPLTVVAGRQSFSYGNSLAIDSAGANNATPTDSGLVAVVGGDLTKQTVLDAIRMVFDYDPLTLELLYSKIDANTLTLANDARDDIDLYGVNSTYELGDDMNTQVEAYFFSRVDKSTSFGNGALETGSKSDTVYMPGLRASANVLEGLNVQGEVAWQRGNRVAATTTVGNNVPHLQNEKRDAIAAQFISNYQIPNDILPDALESYTPVLGYVYTYVSGDSNPNDRGGPGAVPLGKQASTNKFTAWDPMFENQGGGTIYNSLFNLSNLHIHSVSFQANPIEDVTTKVSWNGLWLDKKIHGGNGTLALIQPDGTGATALRFNTGKTDLGNEIDWVTTYDYTEDVQFGANLGWFIPGDIFLGDPGPNAQAGLNGNDKVASQVIVHGNVSF